MTALPLEPHTEAQEATLERVADTLALHDDYRVNEEGWTVCLCGHVAEGDDDDGSHARHLADVLAAAIEAMKGPSPSEMLRSELATSIRANGIWRERLLRVEAVCAELDREGVVQLFHGPHNRNGHITDRIRAALAGPVAQASGTEAGR